MSSPPRYTRWLTAAALLFAAGLAQAELFPLAPAAHADLAREAAAGSREGRRLAVLFEQEDCDACRQLRSKVLSNPATEKDFAARYRSVAVNLSGDAELVTPEGQALAPKRWAERLRIVGTPAVAFFDGTGRLLYRHVGPLASGRELELLGRYVAAGEYERQPFATYRQARQAGHRVNAPQREPACHATS